MSIAPGTWCHVVCGVTMKLEQELTRVADLAFLRSQVDKYARDELMAAHMRMRLDGASRPSVYNGVPGSGKSAALVCMTKATIPDYNEVFVYNKETAE